MTEWTPELEKLLEHEAAYEAESKKIGLNPKEPAFVSILRIAFRGAVENGFGRKESAYNRICEKMGLDLHAKYSDNTRQMIDLAKANGRTDIAKQLGQALYITLEANRLYPHNDGDNILKTVMKRLGGAKRGEIKFGPEA